MSDKLAVLMEFNGYTKGELEAYLSLKFGSMTKGGLTASILSQSGYEKAKSVIFGQPQLNEQQQIAINNAKKSFEKGADLYDCAIDMMLYDGLTDKEWAKATVAFLLWAQKQEEE